MSSVRLPLFLRHGVLLAVAWLMVALPLWAKEVIPPAPARYFNDYAGITSAETRNRLNSELEQFERETSNQIVVVIYPTMQSDSSIEDYTVRVAQKWGVGQKDRSNGAVLFVFANDHKLYLQVGYGLEGAIPDALASRIIQNEIVPSFKAGRFGEGLTRGVHAILSASKGEYKGTGQTVRERRGQSEETPSPVLFFLIIVAIALFFFLTRLQNTGYSSSGRRRYYGNTSYWGSGGGSSGWSSGGGGGGFSGGGGSFGGGGAGGSW